MSRAMGSHQSAKAQSVVWLTPPGIIQALGGCEGIAAAMADFYQMARRVYRVEESDGPEVEPSYRNQRLNSRPYTIL